MSFIDDRLKLKRLDQLIRLEATGSPDELAKKMNVTRRTIFRTMNDLKEIGCPIYFNKDKNSYCYKYKGKLIIEFEEMSNNDLNEIKGGKSYIFPFGDITCHSNDIFLYCETKRICFIGANG